jgi:hypothetical protein
MYTLASGDFATCNGVAHSGLYKLFTDGIIFFGGGPNKLTHTLVYLGEQTTSDGQTDKLVFEADLLVKRTNIINTSVHKWYHWTDPVVQKAMEMALIDIIKWHDGDTYGISQIPWFIWLWTVEKLHLPSRWAKHNIFLSGEICTGIVYLVLMRGLAYLRFLKYTKVDELASIITANGRDYRSQRPVDIEQIGINVVKAGFAEEL